MKRLIIVLVTVSIFACSFANNLQLGTPVVSDPTHIRFTIQWDNSWKVISGPANWDAVWVFLKYQDCTSPNLPWQHVLLSTTSLDHTVTGGVIQIDATTDGGGVFIHRSAAGSGNIVSATVTLKITTPVSDNNYNYQLNGIEMVYIPQANFYIGDGNRGGGNQYGFTGNNAFDPLQITSAIQSAGLTTAQYTFNNWGSLSALPASYPMGYNAFYTMKYEISQEVYTAFLNTLSYNQQSNRFANAPNSAVGTLALAGLSDPLNCRNGIRIKTSGLASSVPAVVGCDLNANGTFDEADDGQNIACNWLSWADLMAFLDWAALRPMTEFEFEKICRGTATPVANEYVWGTTAILATNSGAIANPRTVNEVSSITPPPPPPSFGLCAYGVATNNNRGPLRCGFAASVTSSTRFVAGSTFYGVMDMAGNVAEQCIGGYNGYDYSAFTTTNGDGILTNAGAANTSNWPVLGGGNGGGGVCRGGDWYDNGGQFCITSNRDWTTLNANQTRDYRIGGRGVRTP